MRQIPKPTLVCVAALLFALLALSAAAAQQAAFKLSGRVLGASGKNTLYVALLRSDHFLNTPVKQIRIAPGADTRFEFQVPPGRWALSAFEDRNSNGILDMGLFGPKEPSGFWPAFNGWHKPRFEEVAFSVSADIPHADIILK